MAFIVFSTIAAAILNIQAASAPARESAPARSAEGARVWMESGVVKSSDREDSAPRPVRTLRADLPLFAGLRRGVDAFFSLSATKVVNPSAKKEEFGGADEDADRIFINNTKADSGFINNIALDERRELSLGLAELQQFGAIQWFFMIQGGAPPASKPASGDPSKRMIQERIGSNYPMAPGGARLDVYYLPDAAVASEALPAGGGLSLAGAGDKPRRFMRGHRFEPGSGTIVCIRYLDPSGGSLRISIALPKAAQGRFPLPMKGVAVAATELSPDPETGRVAERLNGNITFNIRETGVALLRLELDISMRAVGSRDPRRLLVFGDFDAVPMTVAELTPWLGKFNQGRPVIETFANPGEETTNK